MPIACSRCGRAGAATVRPPRPAAKGVEVERNLSPAHRQEPQLTQVMLIDGCPLNVVEPEARTALERPVRAFPNVPATPPT
jgi:Fe-S cluster biosynthesis and repair protein YggX